MGRESFCFRVLLGFCSLGRRNGMLCLWVVSRFVLVFCLVFVRWDVRMYCFACLRHESRQSNTSGRPKADKAIHPDVM